MAVTHFSPDTLRPGTKVKIEAPLKYNHKQRFKRPTKGVVQLWGSMKAETFDKNLQPAIILVQGVWIKCGSKTHFISETLLLQGYVTPL